MLGRTHEPCRDHRNNKIVLEEMSFEMGKQNKNFFSSKGTRRIRYGRSYVMLGNKEVYCNESVVNFPTDPPKNACFTDA